MPTPNHATITKSPAAITRALSKTAVILVILSSVGQVVRFVTGHGNMHGIIPFFYVDAEGNLPTCFSASLLLFAAVLLATITILKRKDKSPHVLSWTTLACGFLFMTADELFSYHEQLVEPIQHLLGNGKLGIFHFAWVIPAIAVILFFGLFFFKFLLHLPAKTRRGVLIAATLYLGGAVGFELVEGKYAELCGDNTPIFSLLTTIEESLEMAGAIVFINALLKYIVESYNEVRFRFDDAGQN